MDLSSVLGVLQGAMGATQGLKGQVKTAHDLEQEGIRESTSAKQIQVQQDGIVAMEAAKGEMQAEQNARKVATALGTNLDEPNEILTTIANIARQQAVKASEESAKVAAMEGRSGLFSNPAGFLYDLAYGDGERSKRDAAVEGAQQQQAILDSLNQSTTLAAQAQNAIKATITDASLAAQQESITAASAALEGDMKQMLAGADYKSIAQLSSLNSQEASQAANSYQIRAMDEQRRWAREEAEARRAERNELADLKKEQAKLDMAAVDAYNKGLELAGNDSGYPVNTPAALKQTLSLDKDRTARLIQLGFRAINSGTEGHLGLNPMEAYANNVALQPKSNDAQRLMIRSLDSTVSGATSPESIGKILGLNPKLPSDAKQIENILKDKNQVASLQAQALETKVADDLHIQKPGDYDNFYAPPSLETLSEFQYAKDSEWVQKYIAPQVKDKDFDLDWLTDRGVEAIKSGDASTTDVVDTIKWFTDQASNVNNSTRRYRQRFGMPDQPTVRQEVRIKRGKVFGSTTIDILDGSDPQDITTILNKKMENWKAVNIREAMGAAYREYAPQGIFNFGD